MIPRFLICDTHEYPDREFVLHTQKPRFLAEVVFEDATGTGIEPIEWYDTAPHDVMQAARLMREMGDWYASEIASYSHH